MSSGREKLSTEPGLGISSAQGNNPIGATTPGLGQTDPSSDAEDLPPRSSKSRMPVKDPSADTLLLGLLEPPREQPSRSSSDGRGAASFAAGPHRIPAARTNPADEPAVIVRQSIVDDVELLSREPASGREPRALSLERVGAGTPGSPRRNLTPITQRELEAPIAPPPAMSGRSREMLARASNSAATVIRAVPPPRESNLAAWLWLGALVLLVALGLTAIYMFRPDLLRRGARRSAQVSFVAPSHLELGSLKSS
jgi:hypothetical protein